MSEGQPARHPFQGLHDTGADTPVLVHARGYPLARLREVPAAGFYLADINDCLTLCRAGSPHGHGLHIDFDNADIRRRVAAGRRLPLARALGLHKRAGMRILDATCGLGRDSAVIAGLGGVITGIERHPALYALLCDGLRRADQAVPGWRGNWRALHHDEAVHWLSHAVEATAFDAIYLDPMFDDARRKARPQRAMQWLSELLGADDDAAVLLAEARKRARRRVVVKSHARAAPLAPPDHQVGGRAMRFDIYFSASKDFW